MVQLGGSLLARRRGKASIRTLKVDCASASIAAKAHFANCSGNINDDYDVLEALGHGSMAVVYRGIHRSTGNQVALKVVRGLDEDKLAITKAEYCLLQTINHPGIVRALDFFPTSGGVVLALNYFAGKTLDVAVCCEPEQRLIESTARKLFVSLLQALDFLHERLVVHRDVKPENVLVSTDFQRLQLIDFNVAKLLTEGGSLSPVGTPAYAAPEMLFGGSAVTASDVWGAGLCLHLMLTGSCPRVSLKGGDISVRLQTLELSEVSRDCKDILQQCLLVDHVMRPSALEILQTSWAQDELAVAQETAMGETEA